MVYKIPANIGGGVWNMISGIYAQHPTKIFVRMAFLMIVHFQAEMPDWAGITRIQVNRKKWQKINF
jgi:hypothetical protein